MNEHRLRALREGRERAAAQRQRDEDAAARQYLNWIRDEARAYARWSQSDWQADADRTALYADWRRLCGDRPAVPPDVAFRRLRGEL